MQTTKIKRAHVYLVSRILIYVMLGIMILQVLIYFISPPPSTVEGVYELFVSSPLRGLLGLDLLYLINNTLLIMIYFGLTLYLYQHKPLMSVLALVIGAIGIAAYYAANTAFEFYFLSQSYETANLFEQERLITAGTLLLAQYKGTAFVSYYILNAIALYVYSAALIFVKKIPKIVYIMGFLSAIFMSIPSSFGSFGLIMSLLSLIPWMVFCLLIAYQFQLEIKDAANNP